MHHADAFNPRFTYFMDRNTKEILGELFDTRVFPPLPPQNWSDFIITICHSEPGETSIYQLLS